MQLTKLHIIAFLLLALCLPRAQGALAQAILYTTDNSATNARPSAVTISPSTGGTNLMAGTLTSTNNTTVGAQLHVEGSSRLVGAVTNDALQASTLVYSTATKVLGSLTLGTAGQVLTSAGAGVAPSFQAPFTGTTGTVTGSGTTVANDIAVFTDTTHTNIARSSSAITIGDNSSANVAITGNVSGTDSVMTFGSSSVDVTTGTLKQGGTAVVLQSTIISPGNGMSGGGDLSANRTMTWAPSLWTSGTLTLGDSSQSSIVYTFGLSGAIDPAFTAANNSLSLNVPLLVSGLVTASTGFDATTGNVMLRGGSTANVAWNGLGAIKWASDGVMRVLNDGQTDFNRLQLGGTSSSFPSLKRSGATLQARLADDSAFAGIAAGTLTLTPATADTTALTVNNSVTGSATGPAELHTATFNSSGIVIQHRNVITNTASADGSAFETWETLAGGIQAKLGIEGSLTYNLRATKAAAGTIASAGTIAPTAPVTFISGTTTIDTITAPSPISSTGGQITLIPTGVWATSTSGNIALITTAVVSKALIMTYDQATAKWYPSY